MKEAYPPMHKPVGYQICTKTIMDTSDKEILFDEEGVCNHYHRYKQLEPLYAYQGAGTDRARKEMLDRIRLAGKGKPYDCLIGISGGVDSSYVAYLAHENGLRPLVVHFDNGWNSELAIRNIEQIVRRLNFEYQTWVVDWNEFRDLQKAFLKASVNNAEIPTDHAFLAALYRIAEKNKIKYVLSGSNFVTEGILPKSWGYNAKDLKHLLAIHRLYGSVPLKTYPTLGFKREIYYTYVKGIKMIRFLNYFKYEKADAMKILQEKLGWTYYGGKHYESVFTRFFQAYLLPQKFGIDKRRAHLSTLIASGQISRDAAIEEMKAEAYPADLVKQDIQYVRKKLMLSESEFDAILSDPPRSYKDFPNDEQRLKFIYSIYYKLRGAR